jgi:transcriptional regulator of acetoin/glycerol metabolism
MIALRETDHLGLHDLPPEFRPDLAEATMAPAAVPGQPAAAAPAAPANKPGDGLNPFECAEREVLLQELKRHQWNLSGVARELNISRNTLYRKLQRLNIEHPDKSLFH